jgi:acyl-CoA synthetase (AMP-forming)/AMP-acid ligase II
MIQRLRIAVEEGKRSRPKHLRNIVYGGGPMYVEELRKSTTVLGPVFSQIYGQGEAPVTITGMNQAAHLTEDDAILGSVGWPRSGVEVRVTDSQGKDLPAGSIGEILCRGDVVMTGYWRNPAATAETLRDGWLHTGDMGSFDERGCLTLRDRSKDVIISGGSNIYPREVEEVLLLHPAVAKTSVVGRPDAEWGEVLIAFVVRAEGAEVSAAELDAHCLEHIARFKRPKEYKFLDELPISSYGKVLKTELRKLLENT